jgi:hypothetical protein
MSESSEKAAFVFSRVKVCLSPPQLPSGQKDFSTVRQEAVKNDLSALLAEWRKYDPDIALAPWGAEDQDHPLKVGTESSPIPAHRNIAQFYFYGLNYAAPVLWFHMRVRHTLPIDRLLEANPVFTIRLYLGRLQTSEKPMVGGFFVHSLREYAQSSDLSFAIRNAVQSVCEKSVDVALFWAPINCKSIGLNGPPVMQIEVDEGDYADVRQALVYLYNKHKAYPMHIPMVFIPPPGRCVDQQLPVKACHSQNAFLRVHRIHVFSPFKLDFYLGSPIAVKDSTSLEKLAHVSPGPDDEAASPMTSDEPTSADVEGEPLVPHKVNMTSLLRAISVDKVPVFFAILPAMVKGDKAFLLVTVPGPAGNDLARLVVNSPVAYFKHVLLPSSLDLVFTKLAVAQASSEYFDPVRLRVINTEETTTSETLALFTFDIPLHVRRGLSSAQSTTDTQPFDTFSFSAGSVQTNSLKRIRFQEAANNLMQVPGAPRATGEKK